MSYAEELQDSIAYLRARALRAEAAAEEARQRVDEEQDRAIALTHDLAEARQEREQLRDAAAGELAKRRARISELEAALQKAENFIEKVVWETGYGGVLLEDIRAALQPTTEATQEEGTP